MSSIVLLVVLLIAAFGLGCALPRNHDVKFLR